MPSHVRGVRHVCVPPFVCPCDHPRDRASPGLYAHRQSSAVLSIVPFHVVSLRAWRAPRLAGSRLRRAHRLGVSRLLVRLGYPRLPRWHRLRAFPSRGLRGAAPHAPARGPCILRRRGLALSSEGWLPVENLPCGEAEIIQSHGTKLPMAPHARWSLGRPSCLRVDVWDGARRRRNDERARAVPLGTTLRCARARLVAVHHTRLCISISSQLVHTRHVVTATLFSFVSS